MIRSWLPPPALRIGMTTAFGACRTTPDVSYAVQCGIPRSTARGWISARTVEVVTADVLNMDAAQLQQEVLRLRIRIHKLIALLRVLLVQRIGEVFASASTVVSARPRSPVATAAATRPSDKTKDRVAASIRPRSWHIDLDIDPAAR